MISRRMARTLIGVCVAWAIIMPLVAGVLLWSAPPWARFAVGLVGCLLILAALVVALYRVTTPIRRAAEEVRAGHPGADVVVVSAPDNTAAI